MLGIIINKDSGKCTELGKNKYTVVQSHSSATPPVTHVTHTSKNPRSNPHQHTYKRDRVSVLVRVYTTCSPSNPFFPSPKPVQLEFRLILEGMKKKVTRRHEEGGRGQSDFTPPPSFFKSIQLIDIKTWYV